MDFYHLLILCGIRQICRCRCCVDCLFSLDNCRYLIRWSRLRCMSYHVLNQFVLSLRHDTAQQAGKIRFAGKILFMWMRERILLSHWLNCRSGLNCRRWQLQLILLCRWRKRWKENLMLLKQMLTQCVGVVEDFIATRARILDLWHDCCDGVWS